MATRFRTNRNKAKSPTWCYAAIVPPPVMYIGDIPLRLTVFTYWLDVNHVPPIDINEAFGLNWDPAIPGWSGSSAAAGLRLLCTIERLPADGQYDLHLEVRQDDAYVDDDSWHNQFCELPPQFDSTELEHIYTPKVDANGLHALL